MSFLKRALKNSISKGINDAVSKAVKEAVEPAATNLANKAAMKMEDFAEKKMEEVEKQTELARANAKQAAAETGEAVAEAAARSQNVDMNQLKSAFASLAGMAQDYATEMSEKYKVCPGCGELWMQKRNSVQTAVQKCRSRHWQKEQNVQTAASRMILAQNSVLIAVQSCRQQSQKTMLHRQKLSQ